MIPRPPPVNRCWYTVSVTKPHEEKFIVRWEEMGVSCETQLLNGPAAISFFNKLRSDRGIIAKIVPVAV